MVKESFVKTFLALYDLIAYISQVALQGWDWGFFLVQPIGWGFKCLAITIQIDFKTKVCSWDKLPLWLLMYFLTSIPLWDPERKHIGCCYVQIGWFTADGFLQSWARQVIRLCQTDKLRIPVLLPAIDSIMDSLPKCGFLIASFARKLRKKETTILSSINHMVTN